jgi:hypothetical protein
MSLPHILDRLRQLSTETRPMKVAERGVLRIQVGFISEGLDDLTSAASVVPASYWIEAQLAEAHRAYVRDEMLSTRERLPEVYSYLRANCVDRFAAARRLAEEVGAPSKTIAWIWAHAGAAQTLLYFVMSNSEARKKDRTTMASCFVDALACFDEALAREPNYAWCIHLKAYVKTLRGADGDFEEARALLTRAMTLGGMTTAALNRNLAMLHSYEAAALGDDPSQSPDLERGIKAANDSVQCGLEVMQQDPDDALAAYTVAASIGWLHLRAKQHDCREHLEAAVAAARTRASNTLARTYATLAGLALLQNELATEGDVSIPRFPGSSPFEVDAQRIFERFLTHEIPIDVETWAMLNRDPIWRDHPFYRNLLGLLSQGLDTEAKAAE